VSRACVLAAVALAFAFALPAAQASAGPGDLDPSFGRGGELLAPFGDAAHDLLLLPDRRFVVTGGSSDAGTGGGFTLARFLPAGKPDETFGSRGGTFTPVAGIQGASAVARQPDGKLVLAGDAAGQDAWVLARYNADGTLDSGFGFGGVTLTQALENGAFAADVVVSAGGKLLAAGVLDGAFALVRYNPDGSLDDSFGDGGKVLSPSAHLVPGALVELPDGQLVVGGSGPGPGDTAHQTLVRYNADGTPDESFGSHGRAVGPAGTANALLRQPDGKLVTAGSGGLARYNADGSLDTGFAAASIEGTVNDLVLQPDGKLVAAGMWITLRTTSWIVRRFDSNGAVDSGFCVPPYPPIGRAYAALVQPDGRLLVAGEGAQPGSGFMLRRYVGAGPGPCADLWAPVTSLDIPRQRLARTLRKGLVVAVYSNEPGRAAVRLVLSRREARRVGVRRRAIGRGSHTFIRQGIARFRVRVSRAARPRLERARRVTLTVRLALTDHGGNVTRAKRRLTIRR
jgi:uncharacterized delta-60 repeat protein